MQSKKIKMGKSKNKNNKKKEVLSSSINHDKDGNILLREDWKRELEEKPSGKIYSKAMKFYTQRKQWDQALNLFEQIPSSISKDIFHYNDAMFIYLKKGDLNSARSLFNELKLSPWLRSSNNNELLTSSIPFRNEYTYMILFEEYVKLELWMEIISLFEELIEINFFKKKGEETKKQDKKTEEKKEGQEQQERKEGDEQVDKNIEIFKKEEETKEETQHQPEIQIGKFLWSKYILAIMTLELHFPVSYLDILPDDIQKDPTIYNTNLLNAAIRYCINNRKQLEAFNLVEKMKENNSTKPNSDTYQHLISLSEIENKWQTIINLIDNNFLQYVDRNKTTTTRDIITEEIGTVLITTTTTTTKEIDIRLNLNLNANICRSYLLALQNLNHEITIDIFNNLLLACACKPAYIDNIAVTTTTTTTPEERTIENVKVLFHDIKKYQLLPNAKTYSIFFKACNEAKDWKNIIDMFERFFDELKDNIFKNTPDIWDIYFKAKTFAQEELNFYISGLPLDYFQYIPNRIQRDFIIYNATILHCVKNNKYSEALRLIEEVPNSSIDYEYFDTIEKCTSENRKQHILYENLIQLCKDVRNLPLDTYRRKEMFKSKCIIETKRQSILYDNQLKMLFDREVMAIKLGKEDFNEKKFDAYMESYVKGFINTSDYLHPIELLDSKGFNFFSEDNKRCDDEKKNWDHLLHYFSKKLTSFLKSTSIIEEIGKSMILEVMSHQICCDLFNLITYHTNKEDTEEILMNIFDKLPERLQSVEVYNTVLSGLVKVGATQNFNILFTIMKDGFKKQSLRNNVLQPNAHTYCLAIRLRLGTKQSMNFDCHKARLLLNEMERKNFYMDRKTLNKVVYSFPSPLLPVRELERHHNVGIQLPVQSYNTMFITMEQSSSWEKIIQLVEDMQKQENITVFWGIRLSYALALCHVKRISEGEKILTEYLNLENGNDIYSVVDSVSQSWASGMSKELIAKTIFDQFHDSFIPASEHQRLIEEQMQKNKEVERTKCKMIVSTILHRFEREYEWEQARIYLQKMVDLGVFDEEEKENVSEVLDMYHVNQNAPACDCSGGYCENTVPSNLHCGNGHYICDDCLVTYLELEVEKMKLNPNRMGGKENILCPLHNDRSDPCRTEEGLSLSSIFSVLTNSMNPNSKSVFRNLTNLFFESQKTGGIEKGIALGLEIGQVPELVDEERYHAALRKNGKSYSCPKCGHGPVQLDGCDELNTHHNQIIERGSNLRFSNRCPACNNFEPHIDRWNEWKPVWDIDSLKKKVEDYKKGSKSQEEENGSISTETLDDFLQSSSNEIENVFSSTTEAFSSPLTSNFTFNGINNDNRSSSTSN